MDREISFRGKRLDNGEWVCGNLIQIDEGGSQSFIFPFYKYASSLTCAQIVSMFMVAVDPATVGQYTGFCDKNGVKIFEGDVVFAGYGEYYQGTHEHSTTIIIDMADYEALNALCNANVVEVIGNIHDNAELLKEGQEWLKKILNNII